MTEPALRSYRLQNLTSTLGIGGLINQEALVDNEMTDELLYHVFRDNDYDEIFNYYVHSDVLNRQCEMCGKNVPSDWKYCEDCANQPI